MKKFVKSAVFALALCLCLGVAVTAAGCREKEADKYTVKLVYEDGSPVTDTNVEVQFCLVNEDGEMVTCFETQKIGADGVAVMDSSKWIALEEGQKYHVQINRLPDGCSYDAEAENLFVTKPSTVTVKIKKQ